MGKVKLTGYKKRLYDNLVKFHKEELKRLKLREEKLENSNVNKLKDAEVGLKELKQIRKDIVKVINIEANLKTGFFSHDVIGVDVAKFESRDSYGHHYSTTYNTFKAVEIVVKY